MAHVVRSVLRSIVSCLLCLLPSLVLASDPPDSAVNPRSGSIETADSRWAGSNFKVRHAFKPGPGQSPIVFDVSTDQGDDPDPRLAISSNGDTWVTWWRNSPTGQVLIRKRTYSTGTWSEERLVSASWESGARPRIVHDGTSPWVAYVASSAEGVIVEAVQIIDDGPDPFGSSVVGTTSYTGDLDVQITAESSHLWVTWIDSASNVGWCEYDYGVSAWGLPSYESYASDGPDATRSRIRTTVLGE